MFNSPVDEPAMSEMRYSHVDGYSALDVRGRSLTLNRQGGAAKSQHYVPRYRITKDSRSR